METVLVTGYSKAPQGTSMYEIHKHVGIVLEIDTKTNIIVDASFTFISDLTINFLSRIFIGYNLTDGIDKLIAIIKSRYLAPSQNAVFVALRSAVQRYWDFKNVN